MGTHVALKEARLASSPLELCRLVNEALRVVTLHGTASNAYRGNIRSSRVRRGCQASLILRIWSSLVMRMVQIRTAPPVDRAGPF